MSRAACARIDLGALRHNLAIARSSAPSSRVMAVVKADAYGNGSVACAQALDDADGFAVVGLEEAAVLRDAGIDKRILLLEGFFEPSELPEIRKLGLDIVVHAREQIDALEAAGLTDPISVWLKIDTGMHRLGIDPAEVPACVARLGDIPAVRDLQLMTHLACADERGSAYTRTQLQRFFQTCEGYDHMRSIANSAAILGWPEAHADWVRPGIMLYGSSPFENGEAGEENLRAVMSLESELIAVRDLAAGEPVGYGCTWRAERDGRIGVVAIGYADGYPRHAPSGTPVLVDGLRTSLVGRVSMDMITVDLDPVPDAGPGSSVRLWGDGLSIDEVARAAGTISYELLTKVTQRVPRVYRNA